MTFRAIWENTNIYRKLQMLLFGNLWKHLASVSVSSGRAGSNKDSIPNYKTTITISKGLIMVPIARKAQYDNNRYNISFEPSLYLFLLHKTCQITSRTENQNGKATTTQIIE